MLHPNLRESLPLAVIVAKDVNGVTLPQPAVKLIKKFAPLHLGNLRIGRAFAKRTECIERTEDWSAGCGVWSAAFRRPVPAKGGTPILVHFAHPQLRHPADLDCVAKLFPRDEEWITGWNLLCVFRSEERRVGEECRA